MATVKTTCRHLFSGTPTPTGPEMLTLDVQQVATSSRCVVQLSAGAASYKQHLRSRLPNRNTWPALVQHRKPSGFGISSNNSVSSRLNQPNYSVTIKVPLLLQRILEITCWNGISRDVILTWNRTFWHGIVSDHCAVKTCANDIILTVDW